MFTVEKKREEIFPFTTIFDFAKVYYFGSVYKLYKKRKRLFFDRLSVYQDTHAHTFF